MRYVTAGESHGRGLVAIVTGVPAGVRLSQEDFDRDLARRQVGYGRGGRMRIESDKADVIAGVRHGRTLGSPVAAVVWNADWESWNDTMSAFGSATEGERLTTPRPGHADLAGVLKTGSDDVRDVLERASARETAGRVAAGAVARALLRDLDVRVFSWVERIGPISAGPYQPEGLDTAVIEASDVRCPDSDAAAAMRAAIDAAREAGESLGGVAAVSAIGCLPGLGGYAEAAERLDGRLAAAVMSIPAIKGVEIGQGFAGAAMPGSEVHDVIRHSEGRGFHRASNRAGGLEGGMTNGEPVVMRAAMKPIPTLMKPLETADIASHAVSDAARERSDVCAVPAAGVVAEAEVAIVLADAYCRKFGADSLDAMLAAVDAYRRRVSS